MSPQPLLTTEAEDTTLPRELKNIPSDWIKYPKQAIFNVSNPHPDTFLVVRIDVFLYFSTFYIFIIRGIYISFSFCTYDA